ncbi:MAG: S8 family peptidase [Anaerolineae bacterium]|jgi:subtilisin family serine protease|nr:S8 family serine peptidase [Chloroflexota bacterium]
MRRTITNLVLVLVLVLLAAMPAMAAPDPQVGVNVVLKGDITAEDLAALGQFGQVQQQLPAIDAVILRARASQLEAIRALPSVAAASLDAPRSAGPTSTLPVADFADGLSTWNLDAINVTDFGFGNRMVAQTGEGVYVAVLDTGLVRDWRNVFPEERIAVEYARSFGGGANENANVSEQPNKWERDVNSHGTHVTSTILGYALNGTPVAGVAPLARVIPVKVLNQNGSGWSSVIAQGIVYIADLKAGPLQNAPVVINMSLGGPELDAVEKAAIDYAVSKGVIIVAAAGNEGMAGMGYPGAYEPVISVAAAGFTWQWVVGPWWYAIDDPEPNDAANYFIGDFSSRAWPGQDLDVTAPGVSVVGPYKVNNGNEMTYYFLGGTSMASPHVAGIVALMAEKNPALTAGQAEAILEGTALPLPPACRVVGSPAGAQEYCWEANATGAGLALADQALMATP